jgi:hypothetical protein
MVGGDLGEPGADGGERDLTGKVERAPGMLDGECPAELLLGLLEGGDAMAAEDFGHVDLGGVGGGTAGRRRPVGARRERLRLRRTDLRRRVSGVGGRGLWLEDEGVRSSWGLGGRLEPGGGLRVFLDSYAV